MIMNQLVIRHYSNSDYRKIYNAMIEFTAGRNSDTPDEFWLLQHNPVFTQGLGGKAEHVLSPGHIPVIMTDRGGQVTYHGPGQLVIYFMINLKRKVLSIKGFVRQIEQAVINLCHEFNINAERKAGAPGIYVNEKKIGALGIRVKKGCSYHGLSLNIDMDLEPFKRINPCGYPGLEVTDFSDLNIKISVDELSELLLPYLINCLGFKNYRINRKKGNNEVSDTYQAA